MPTVVSWAGWKWVKPSVGQVALAGGEAGQGVDDADQPVAQQAKPFAHQHQVGVVGDVAAGGAEVDDVAGGGAASP